MCGRNHRHEYRPVTRRRHTLMRKLLSFAIRLGKYLYRTSWLSWIIGLIILGPVVWVVIYRFVDPPVTMNMRAEAQHAIEREWMPLSGISPNLMDAALAASDPDFCTHHGFARNLVRVVWRGTAPGRESDGAPSISIATVRSAFLWPEHNWLRSVLEPYFTFLTELLWPKRRIMEVYLNAARWGDGIFGAQAAAEQYFGTNAGMLSLAQAARLVAVLPNPTRWSPEGNMPQVYFRAVALQREAELVKVDGKAACLDRQ